MTARALAFALVVAVTSLAAPTVVHADDPVEDDAAGRRAKKLYAEGDKLFNLGKFAAALVKFEKAYETKPIPGLLFNIGQCHRNLDDYDAAIFSFRKYLKLLPEAANRDAVLEYIDELEREKQKKSSSDLSLIGPDTDTDRQIDKGPGTSKPIYKKWWFWGGIVAVGAGVTGALVLSGGGGPPSTGLGNVDFGK